MKLENTNVYNMLEAIRAMRLSYGSEGDTLAMYRADNFWGSVLHKVDIGPKDEELIKKLVAEGPSHRKFMRQILLSVDITAPRYWWTQFDTYKVGVTACSESTMHTLMKEPITWQDFAAIVQEPWHDFAATVPEQYIDFLEGLRKAGEFRQLVAMLPQGYMQKRHVTMNYEVVRTIREQRKGHKLAEWQEFIGWSDELPCAALFFGSNNA